MELTNEEFNLEITNVQSMWNMLINIVDKLAPLTEFKGSIMTKSSTTPTIFTML